MDKQIWIRRILERRFFLDAILISILLFSFVIRIYHLNTNPPELFSDEITHVLSARTIIETGKDINGKINLYLYNRLKLGAPIYGYLAAVSTYIFGNNVVATRLPAALAGTLTVFLIYKLSLLIVKNKQVSLLSAFVASVLPWNIYFSRIAWEPSLILPFLLSGILTFYYYVDSEKIQKNILPYIIFAIAIYASDALEFLAPIFLSTLIFLNIKRVLKNKYKHLLGLVVFTIILIPYSLVIKDNPLKYERSLNISTFNHGINTTSVNSFVKNYLSHFSPQFLFISGDPNLRHGTGNNGVIYWSMLPFIILGILYSIRHINKNYSLLLLIWLITFPLGGSLTNDGVPHATRTLIGSPIFIILFTIGIHYVLELIRNQKRKILFITFFIFVLNLEFLNFIQNYFIIYPIKSQGAWDYGQKQSFSVIKSISSGNESLCLTNVEHWHQDTYPNYYLGVGNKYKIIFDINNPDCFTSDIIKVEPGIKVPVKYKLIETINSLDKKPIMSIYRSI